MQRAGFYVVLLLAVLVSVTLLGPLMGDDRGKPKGEGIGPKKLRIVVLEGTPYERGQTHGKSLKDPIREGVRLWKDDLRKQLKIDPDAFIKQFVNKTQFGPSIKKWTPDLLDEIRGIADATAIDYDTLFAYQFVDEVWVYADKLGAEHCSAMGFARNAKEPTHIAQNMDLEIIRDGTHTVLHIKYPDSDLECLVLTCAGMVAVNGLNNKGVGVCCNTLMQLSNSHDGLPVSCVIRGILQQRSEKDARAFLGRVKHASGENYLIGGPSHVHDLECSAGKVVEYKPKGGDSAVWHTNHPLGNDDHSEKHKAALKKNEKDPDYECSLGRFESLQRRLEKESTAARFDLIKATLASKDSARHPICGSKGKDEYYTEAGWFTWASTIMVLSDNPEFFVAPGPPDTTPYQRLSFSKK